MSISHRLYTVASLTLLVALACSGCCPSPTGTPSPTCTSKMIPTPAPSPTGLISLTLTIEGGSRVCEHKFRKETAIYTKTSREYIKGQAIITGDSTAISQVMTSRLQSLIEPSKVLSVTLPKSGVIQRVTVAPGTTVSDFVIDFNKTAIAISPTLGVEPPVAEPNYVIRDPGKSAGISGHPGSSGVECDPATGPAHVDATADNFYNQWALTGDCGIGLDAIFDYTPTNPYKVDAGRDVQIIIFDSSPLSQGSHKIDLGEGYPSYDLCVSTPVTFTSQALHMDSHGLFIANLAHAVAPGSPIHLVQVLQYDDKSEMIRGDLFSLLNAMDLYLANVYTPTVVNLSLGFDAHPSTHSITLTQVITSVISVLGNRYDTMKEDFGVNSGFLPVYSLPTMLSDYYEGGNIVFVAAAGNDGRGAQQQVPAIYPEVIGVAASDHHNCSQRRNACFSNLGDVRAPGGGDNNCTLDMRGRCSGSINCEDGVMSVIITDDGDISYAYWAGTSFSTPLVSGMAAIDLYVSGTPQCVQRNFCSAAAASCEDILIEALVPQVTPSP